MIELAGPTKVFGRGPGSNRAVDDLTCSIEPGVVTGFLGPDGAGKTTTMRMILGLDRPTSGTATINGKSYRQLADPLRTVGALLDARQAHANRSARDHLRWIAATNRIAVARVDEVLDVVGLISVADSGSALSVRGAAIEVIGDLAARNGITLHELSTQRASLEEAYLKLTYDAVEYRTVNR